MKRSLLPCLLLAFLLMPDRPLRAQAQVGQDIDGEAANDQSGRSVCMPDAVTIAIGAAGNDGNGSGSGHVRVYAFDGSDWVQKGADIDGEAMYDGSGWSLSMGDANTVAIGAPENQGMGFWAGHVRVFAWNGTSWIQKGADIDARNGTDKAGNAVSMPDANTVAIGAWEGDVNFFDSGEVRVFSWDGNAWVIKGVPLSGTGSSVFAGLSVTMPDSNTVAYGSLFGRPAPGVNTGDVVVYRWNGTAWVQKGQTLYGLADGDSFGESVSMPDSNTLAVGASVNGFSGPFSGMARVYDWNGTAWAIRGADLFGPTGGGFGQSVSMPDNLTLAVGAPHDSSGSTRIYNWLGNAWTQVGTTIYGEDPGDLAGWSVSMPDPETVGIGSFNNGDLDTMAGSARVFGELPVRIQPSVSRHLSVWPNPTSGRFHLDLGRDIATPANVTVRNVVGVHVAQVGVAVPGRVALDLPVVAGVYFVEVVCADGERLVERVVRW